MPLSNDSARKTAPCQPDNNLDVDSTAQLQLIDLGRLHQGDGGEAAKLFKAAKEDGVFYVDLRDQPFMGMIDTVDDIFALSKELFSLSKEEKMEYDIDELGALKLNG